MTREGRDTVRSTYSERDRIYNILLDIYQYNIHYINVLNITHTHTYIYINAIIYKYVYVRNNILHLYNIHLIYIYIYIYYIIQYDV
jgi:hypothetical protein